MSASKVQERDLLKLASSESGSALSYEPTAISIPPLMTPMQKLNARDEPLPASDKVKLHSMR